MSNLDTQLEQTATSALKTCHFIFPGDINTASGGYRYDREIIRGLQAQNWEVSLISLEGAYPNPTHEDKALAQHAVDDLPESSLVVIDGLALGASPELAEHVARKHRLIALVHHPLCLESGIDPRLAADLKTLEIAALKYATHVIVTSSATKTNFEELMGVPSQNISVVLPGTDRPDLSCLQRKNTSSEPVKLLCVGSLVPRKGQLHLVEAMSKLQDLEWQLDLIGSTSFAPDYAVQVRKRIAHYGLSDRINLRGGIPKAELTGFYERADVFVLPTYYEGYGMAFAEAMSFGLPVIASGDGAVSSTVPSSAGIHFKVGDESELKDALHLLLTDSTRRQELSKGAAAAARALPDWNESAQAFSSILEAQL
ncbi:glycosyltransferase family 4 protein [Pseudovibrio sp. Tun.PSC04-5.I4]|uniref:glycosyltransferase family 4 protein n=1 Tax=Pseudovibrio sp. Tun.PSC04-5.I4 TaxID=1798213 RepID=UPI00088AE349|nr:glycosyltransferase family 4 protein [Pseudovibrio sp. Tun.PSC04-5.I4]SDR21641.1 Glycosyltransferase involved in cell wall bisynthesis [Pseudovibrio sp. Tun.PSC04-5.I4]